VVVAGVLLAIVGGLLLGTDASRDVQRRLEDRADRIAAVIELQFARYRGASRAAAAVRARDPSQAEWVASIDRLDVAGDLPSVFSVGTATLVQRPGGGRGLVIDRVAPLAPNRAALGLDVLQVAGAGRASARALEQEVVSLSDALTLAQEPGDQLGLAVYAPWYDADGTVGGVTTTALRGQDFVESLAAELGTLGVVLVDVDVGGEPRVIGELGTVVDGAATARRSITPLGQDWTLTVTAPAGFASTSERLAGPLTSLALLAVTLLVGALVTVLERREEHARAEVSARTAALRATNEELARAMRARDDFLGVMTHEFRTPLTVIRGFASTAARHGTEVEPARLDDWLRRIDGAARRLSDLTDNVLTIMELRSGHLAVSLEPVAVGPVLEAATADRAAAVEVDRSGSVVAMADPRHLRHVVDALLANAVTYGQPPVVVTAGADDGRAWIRVRDHGEGLPEDLAARVFLPFEQADHGDTRRSRGLGLGLTVVEELCTLMGGSVHLLSGGARGTCVEVRLAAVQAAGAHGAER
jgi:signal transduction histidine kinase